MLLQFYHFATILYCRNNGDTDIPTTDGSGTTTGTVMSGSGTLTGTITKRFNHQKGLITLMD